MSWFNEQVLGYCEREEITLREFAPRMDVSERLLHMKMRGQRGITAKDMYNLARLLGTSMERVYVMTRRV